MYYYLHNLFGYLHGCIEIYYIYIPVCSDAVAGCQECKAADGSCTKCTTPKVLHANTCIGKKKLYIFHGIIYTTEYKQSLSHMV